MAALTPEARAARILHTREMAANLIEDISHMRNLTRSRQLSRTEIRLLSGLLRRILIADRDLTAVAAPRIGRVMLTAPDNQPVYKHSKRHFIAFFQSGVPNNIGMGTRGILVQPSQTATDIRDFDRDKLVTLRLDNFLSQNVLCLNEEWVTRGDVIKYVANYASGVHTNAPITATDKTISLMRRVVQYKPNATGRTAILHTGALDNITLPPLELSDGAMDVVLVELLGAAHYLCISDDVAQLEAVIRSELA